MGIGRSSVSTSGSVTRDAAHEVIARALEGVQALDGVFDASFDAAVEKLHAIKGRVIVSGMGKSGHVARKIAATMASTGTPAHFVHPSEASHGDLGMITPDDAIICLSNSGETTELRDMIAYARRFNVLLIGLVRREKSVLVDAADIAFVLPDIPEASPTGAPTTSTTMMLVFGDALAMALLEKRGFTREDFGTFHPGGKLGQAFIRVRDLMHDAQELPLVGTEAIMQEVLLTMTERRFGCAGVVNDAGMLIGVITDGDLRRHMAADLLHKKASDVMSATPITSTPGQLAAEALSIMNDKSITCLFVVEAGAPIGILHIHDCLRAGVM
jgi:arabinose-5-phosphate isomerase